MITDNYCKDKTAGSKKSTKKIQIWPGYCKNIQGEPLITRIQKIIWEAKLKLGGSGVSQLIKEVVQRLVQLAQAGEFCVYHSIQFCQPVMPVICRRNYQRFNKVCYIPEPTESIPPMPFSGFHRIRRNYQGKKSKGNKNQGKPLFLIF